MNNPIHRHFTLVEVLVTIAIIVILAGILVGGISFATRREDEAKTIATMETLAAAIEAHRVDRGFYPPAETAVEVELTTDSDGMLFKVSDTKSIKFYSRQGKKPYLEADTGTQQPQDAWGNKFHYQCPGVHNSKSYDLWSYGLDGKSSSDDDRIDDITNWSDNNK